ncbi:MAG: transposase [Desulfomicrobium sp.]|nr:transposase [Desulfomicrobium sp.]
MKKCKAYLFTLKTDSLLERQMSRYAGSCRFVWNRALALEKGRLDAGEKILRYNDMAAQLVAWKREPETAWLCEAPSHALQQTLRNLDRALMDAFDKKSPKRFPNFKKKGVHDSFRFPDPKQFCLDQANGRIKLPKLGWVRYRKSRDVEGDVKQVTVSRRGKRWCMSILAEQMVPEPRHASTSEVGIDLGVRAFASFSDGTLVSPLNSFRALEKNLAKAQRSLARKVKFSANWRKQKARIAALHERIANARGDFLHKLSTDVCKNHALIVVEDLRVSSMSRSAKGTALAPGRNVRAKAGLNKSILDQGWGEFRRQLEYKALWAGGVLVAVPPQYTSQSCPACGLVDAGNRRRAEFRCLGCGHTADADVNAAINILAAGHAVLACGAVKAQATAAKQEPLHAA